VLENGAIGAVSGRVGGRKEDAMTTQVPGGLDFEVLRRAIEGRDAETPRW